MSEQATDPAVSEPLFPAIPHWHSKEKGTLTITEGEGARVFDENGNSYLDFCSQLVCTNAGHDNEAIIEAIYEQLQRIPYVASGEGNDTRTELAERLLEVGPESLSDVFFSISGSDAVEAATHIARTHSEGSKILTRYRSYHGSTYGAGTLTGDPVTKNALARYADTTGRVHFLPPLSYRSPFDADSEAELAEAAADHVEYVIKNEGPDSVAGLLTEPIAGSSGAFTAPEGYFERIREICDEYDVLLIVDEVMTGFGRCGDWFGIQTEGVQPDVMTFAKAVTGSYAPLAGVMVNAEVAERINEDGLAIGQTWGGHPASCAAGLAAIDEYENGLLDNVRELSPYLEGRLRELEDEHAVVGDVRGRGLHWAVEITDPETGEPFFDNRYEDGEDVNKHVLRTAAAEHNVLFSPGKPSFQIMVAPPFCIDRDDVDEAVGALSASIVDVFES